VAEQNSAYGSTLQDYRRFVIKRLIGFIFLYTAFSFFLCWRKFISFSYHDFDLAVHAQSVWNILHGSLDCSILGVPFLGNHFVLILFLIAPLYALFPSPLFLLFLQSLLLGGGAFFIYRLAERLLGRSFAVPFSFVYLLYPALTFVNLFEFHPVAFAIFFLLGAFEAFERKAFVPFLVYLLLALSCQEDVSIVVATLGFYGILRKRSFLWIGVPLALGIGWFSLSVLFWMPRWNPGTIDFSLLYKHLGANALEVFGSILAHPLKTFLLMSEGPERQLFLRQLLLPLAFLPLLDPKSFLLAIPPFMEQLLSRRPAQQSLYYHYTALLIPTLFYATLHGMKRLLRFSWARSSVRVFHILWISLAVVMVFGIGSFSSMASVLSETGLTQTDRVRDELLKEIPEKASVAATFEFLPHLANRRALYPIHRFFTGLNTLSGKPYRIPEDIQFLLIDFNDPLTLSFIDQSGGSAERMKKFLKGWKVRKIFQDLVFFERGEGPFLMRPADKNFLPKQAVGTTVEGAFTFVGFNAIATAPVREEALPLRFVWKCLRPSPKTYGFLLTVRDENQKVISQAYHSIGYRLFPSFLWRSGDRFEEEYHLLLPPSPPLEKRYRIYLSFVDENAGKLVLSEKAGPPQATLFLGTVTRGG